MIRWGTIAIVVVLAVVGCGTSATASQGAIRAHVAHVVIVVFENREESTIDKSDEAPAFEQFAARYADLSNYTAITHPSLPNYLALVSGSTHGVTNDCDSCGPWPHSIGGLLTASGRTWGGYAEGYPSSPRFTKRHMPFLYFTDGGSHVRPLSKLDDRHLPAYSFVAPDLCHDAHDCPLSSAEAFLENFLPPLLRVPRTAVFVVFDEGTTSIGGGGRIEAFVAGTAVKRHVVVRRHIDHYTILRTVEDLFGLRHLGASRTALPLTGIWR
ncbi:MAG TPA: alkaline phosphatase family protein [Gaiellaceae bacterium]|nr:alkaline phosphatase family protein [Gaiellaceae bacterium]